MTYKINAECEIYGEWKSFDEFWDAAESGDKFTDYLVEHYPDLIIGASNVGMISFTLIFKSEQHYHWFLLQQ